MIANHAEGTFVLLRYSFGGNRPSQTDRLPLSRARIHGSRLDVTYTKGGVSLSAPPSPKGWVQSLPLTLSIEQVTSVTAYSKGARGLSVLPRVCGIFTAITTSPR